MGMRTRENIWNGHSKIRNYTEGRRRRSRGGQGRWGWGGGLSRNCDKRERIKKIKSSGVGVARAYWFFYSGAAANDLTLPPGCKHGPNKVIRRMTCRTWCSAEIDAHLPLRILDHVATRDPSTQSSSRRDPGTVLRHHLATAQSGHIFPIVTGHAGMWQHPRATVIYCGH